MLDHQPPGVNFNKRPAFRGNVSIKLKGTAKYIYGVLFAHYSNDKGEVLVRFLRKTGLKPKKIVMVDDRRENLVHVEKALKKRKVTFVGFRYGGADEVVKRFDPNVAEVQMKWFGKILSDDAARTLYKEGK